MAQAPMEQADSRWYSVSVSGTTEAAGSIYRYVATVSTPENLSGKKIIPTYIPDAAVYAWPALLDRTNSNKDIKVSLNRHSSATLDGTLYIQVFD